MKDEKNTNETGGNAVAEGIETQDLDQLIEPLRRENENLRELLRLRDARETVVAELQKAGARSPALLFAHAADGLQFDDEGKAVNVVATVEKLRREFPEQFGRVGAVSIDGGAGAVSNTTRLTKDALRKMKPAEIARLDWAEVREVLSEA